MADRTVVPTPAGRGLGYPVSFAGGGLKPSVPTHPTPQDVQDAAGGQLRFVIQSSRGSMSFLRGFGTRAHEMLFRANNPSAPSVIVEDSKHAVETFLPYLKLINIQTKTVEDGIVISLVHQHQQSLIPGETKVEVR